MAWIAGDGSDCWSACHGKGGLCEGKCGDHGFCCTTDPLKFHLNGDGPDQCGTAQQKSLIGHKKAKIHHICSIAVIGITSLFPFNGRTIHKG